ncbi:MAG TPA: restriction endonuclease [Acholeplasmatales bacterium]|nr:restriction endonuclease [Acholeplasmatales bacterium]
MAKRKKLSKNEIINIGLLVVIIIAFFWTSLKNKETWAIVTSIVLCIALTLGIFFFFKYKRNRKIKIFSTKMREIDKMNGIEFEQYLGELYSALGYKTKVTQASGDFGADLILEKDQLRTVVQAKHYKNPVGYKAIQEIDSAKNIYKADEAIVVTNSPSFTRQAISGAKKLRVKLVSRKDLQKFIDSVGNSKQENGRTK